MPAPIEGKIAAILNESVLVINVGGDAGVREGMVFVVLAEGGAVKDPDTGEALGRWEVPKGHVRATLVQPRLSTCAAVDLFQSQGEKADPSTQTLSAAMIAASFDRARAGGTKLNVRRADISGMPEIGPIQVGDRVRSIPEAQ